MMLKPFRIRRLYDSEDPSPVVQITGVQYDSTVKSQPDAALSYLDDDDGETILVGSSLELEQRLEEPVPTPPPAHDLSSRPLDGTNNLLHTFDIQHSSASLATWREHEAYSSKVLRKSLSKSSGSEDISTHTESESESLLPAPAVPRRNQNSSVRPEDAIAGALQGLEIHVGIFAGFLQDASNALRDAAETTREADINAVGGILDGFKGILGEVGKVGKAMIDAFDPEAFAATQEFVPTAMERITVPDPVARAQPVRSGTQVQNVRPNSGERQASGSSTPTRINEVASYHSEAGSDVPLSLSRSQADSCSRRPAPTRANRPSAFIRPMPPNSEAPFAAYASIQNPWNLTTESRSNNSLVCDYCRNRKISCSGKPVFSEGGCQKCFHDQQPCSLTKPRGTAPDRISIVLPTPQVHEDTSTMPDRSATNEQRPLIHVARRNNQFHLPRETAFAQPSVLAASRSILDLENSDPDFSKRYPPLTVSLRKSKTIGSLADRAKSPFLANINPEAEISRFPSLSQIESNMRSDRHRENRDRNASIRWSFDEDRQSSQPTTLRSELAMPPAPAPTLPGAWPELRPEVEGPTLPTSEESSGAFFDRMTRSRSPEPTAKTAQYIPAHLRRPFALSVDTAQAPRHLRHPLTVDTDCVPRHIRQPRLHDGSGPQLGRSKTVTASNPAARLTKPFDPLEDSRQSRVVHGLPRRSETERYRRRPYTERFTGAGRMPWESFESESSSRFDRPAAARPDLRTNLRDTVASSGGGVASAGFGIPDSVTQCVKQLKNMGYGGLSPHEANRLSVYAAVCGGNVMDAVEMIEEDRKAGLQRQLVGE